MQNGEDPELVDAIAGNIIALAKKEERLQLIREKMAALGAKSDPCVRDTTKPNQTPTPHAAQASPSAETNGSSATTGGQEAAAAVPSFFESRVCSGSSLLFDFHGVSLHLLVSA